MGAEQTKVLTFFDCKSVNLVLVKERSRKNIPKQREV